MLSPAAKLDFGLMHSSTSSRKGNKSVSVKARIPGISILTSRLMPSTVVSTELVIALWHSLWMKMSGLLGKRSLQQLNFVFPALKTVILFECVNSKGTSSMCSDKLNLCKCQPPFLFFAKWSAQRCFPANLTISTMSSLSVKDIMPDCPNSNSRTFFSPFDSATALSPVIFSPSSSPPCNFAQASFKNAQSSMPPSRALGSPSASSYSSINSSGKLASLRPSSTKAFWRSSESSSHAKVGFGPEAQLTFPVEPRNTGKTADLSEAFMVAAASIICKRSPRNGKTEKNSSSCIPLKMTWEQQYVINSCMAPAMTPSSNILFQLLSKDGSRSNSSGRGSDLRDESRANPPWIQAEQFVLKGVGRPTQILPQRCSSSKGFTLTAHAPCG
mmetsp:Transcript_124327/g.310825  ORF Transcript_124327/g.310825 Transcript_124327/m.310825 type:complete len:386 (+) Transcript_124327:5906-7063(+)